MRLYFLRHADALEGGDDAARPLSPAGRQGARKIGRFLKRIGVEFDAAYSSPLVRARQTAEIVLAITNRPAPPKLKLDDALLNDATDFSRWLADLPVAPQVLLVGHAPSLAERLGRLLGMEDPDRIKLPKAGLACVETEDQHAARLKFLVSAKVL
ncbi:MAG: SixA phosphatase family protein [Limisphaerales bacterium]